MRDVYLHEKVAFLAFGLLAGGSTRFVRVQLGDSYADHRSTDLFLVRKGHGRHARLRIDLTEGHRQTRNRKFQQNKEHKKRGGHWVWILSVPREDVISIGADSCFDTAWSGAATYEPVTLSPEDICPEHGERCSLVEKLNVLGGFLIPQLPEDWQALFE